MKITFNFISILLIITLCTTMCLLGGCNNVADNNLYSNSDVSYVESKITIYNSADTSVNTDTTSGEISDNSNESSADNSAAENPTDNGNSAVESSSTPAPESQPAVSTPEYTSSQEVSSATPSQDTPFVETSKPTDALIETPTYPTLQLEVPTTYYGYSGYFTLNSNPEDIHLIESGLAITNYGSTASTEYHDINTDATIFFVFDATIVEYKDLLYNHVFIVGVGTTDVNAVY